MATIIFIVIFTLVMFLSSIYKLMVENCEIYGLNISKCILNGESLDASDIVLINGFIFMFACITGLYYKTN
jgi:hypothetical protein